jgi:phosphonate transport system permease protein
MTKGSQLKAISVFSAILLVVIISFLYLDISLYDTFAAFPAFAVFFATRFMPPNFSAIPQAINLIVQTLFFAVVGTGIASVLALFGGLILSEKINNAAWLRMAFRAFLSVLRNIPILVWVSLLIFIFGIGSMVGLIAIILATVGFLSRSYAESLSEVAGEKLEALHAVGAGKVQIICHGILPEFVPAWINWTLFTFEINLRASAILGMVGAGGIGLMISTHLRLFRYPSALSLIIVITSLILVTEFITNKLRGRMQ